MTKLEELKSLLKEMQDLTTACVLLDWDLKTETPKHGVDAVVSSLTALSTKQFELSISPKMEEADAKPLVKYFKEKYGEIYGL